MRKVAVKSSSKSKSKQLSHPEVSHRPQIIQTQTGTRNNSTHRQSKHRSQLHPIHQLPLFNKHNRKQSGHQRRTSKISHQSSHHCESNMRTFGPHDHEQIPTASNDFNYQQIETLGLDGVLTSRNRPQLPINITGQLSSFKNKSININVSILEEEKKTQQRRNIDKKPKEWSDTKIPISSKQALRHYSHYLTQAQREEVLQYQNVYYLGHKIDKSQTPLNRPEHDNEESQYVYTLNGHIAYRYQILRFLGKGSYGQVFQVFDHKSRKEVALKMIKNRKKHTRQAQIEINILNTIKSADPEGFAGIVRIKDSFIFRQHQCIVFQLLSDNLYQLIKYNNYVGLNVQLIKKFCIQLLNSLNFLKQHKILHCDLKPENILLVENNKARIKIIDFGSSCFNNQIIYEYIQSRYYRAPEVTLGMPYNERIDMWSLGCILVELYTGMPLFPGNTEQQQMGYMILTLGLPPQNLLRSAKRRRQFFNEDLTVRNQLKCRRAGGNMGKQLKQIIKNQLFLDFIQKILKWNPQQRLNPKQALEHKWVLQGLPDQIKHLNSLFDQVNNNRRKESKQNHGRTKVLNGIQQKRPRMPLHSASNRKQNKSVPNKELKSKPNTARKPSHQVSLYRSKELSVDK